MVLELAILLLLRPPSPVVLLLFLLLVFSPLPLLSSLPSSSSYFLFKLLLFSSSPPSRHPLPFLLVLVKTYDMNGIVNAPVRPKLSLHILIPQQPHLRRQMLAVSPE